MDFSTLYTLSANGIIRFWQIKVVEDLSDPSRVKIIREYGKHQGKTIVSEKVVSEGKMDRTVLQQAIAEAQRYFDDMVKKKGYVSDMSLLSSTMNQLLQTSTQTPTQTPIQASTQSLDGIPFKIKFKVPSTSTSASPENPNESFIPLKFLPMLAHTFDESKQYIKYPAMVQPKLDGIRQSARKLPNGEVVIKSRNDSELLYFHEIKQAIARLPLGPNIILDGEFYSHAIPFRVINGYCNRKKLGGKTGFSTIPAADLASIHYHLFDCYFILEPQKPFSERYQFLRQLMESNSSPYLELVPVFEVDTLKEIREHQTRFIQEGYEGAIIRNIDGVYQLKNRSNDLIKFKSFLDDEFVIAGATCPTEGKEEGCIVWTLRVSPTSDLTFSCRPRDPYDVRKADWIAFNQHPERYIGQLYTVRFQERYENGVPRFPVGISQRQDLL